MDTISRKDFLKKFAVGALGALAVTALPKSITEAATVRDNLNSGGGAAVGATAPADKSKIWIDTSSGGRGVVKYWTGSAWSATASVWDS